MFPLRFPALVFLLLPGSVMGQAAGPSDSLPGRPITSDLVVRHCSACHTRDSTGRMSRLSYLRKAPEGWQTSVRRMATLNGVQLEPDAAREIVRYLANQHGLSPEEANAGRFEVERRMIDYTYAADKDTESTCKACHSMGRVLLQRRTKEEWELLVAMHRGYYPTVDFQGFRRFGPPPDSGDGRHPMDKAIEHLAKAFPLETPAWQAWSATMRPDSRSRHHQRGSGPARRIHHRDHLAVRAGWTAGLAPGPGSDLHRFPMARTLARGQRRRVGAAGGDDG